MMVALINWLKTKEVLKLKKMPHIKQGFERKNKLLIFNATNGVTFFFTINKVANCTIAKG